MAFVAVQAHLAYFEERESCFAEKRSVEIITAHDRVTGRSNGHASGRRQPLHIRAPPATGAAGSRFGGRMTNSRLLILDDDPHIGRMVQLIAESAGFAARFMTTTAEFFH